jgi:hypothetical protein
MTVFANPIQQFMLDKGFQSDDGKGWYRNPPLGGLIYLHPHEAKFWYQSELRARINELQQFYKKTSLRYLVLAKGEAVDRMDLLQTLLKESEEL